VTNQFFLAMNLMHLTGTSETAKVLMREAEGADDDEEAEEEAEEA
jgi:hypothetical protein